MGGVVVVVVVVVVEVVRGYSTRCCRESMIRVLRTSSGVVISAASAPEREPKSADSMGVMCARVFVVVAVVDDGDGDDDDKDFSFLFAQFNFNASHSGN